MRMQRRWASFRADRSSEGGYVAVMTGLLLMVLMGIAAFAVDVGHWYVVGQQEQRAADAAALAGVTYLPANSTGAYATAQNFAKGNGFENLPSATTNPTTVTTGLDGGRPTRLRVTVTRTVDNIFGPLLGIPKTTVSRTAVADYAGPVPMGSPCNAFANDPDPSASTNRASTCTSATQFWANIGSLGQTKVSGDAYQDTVCAANVDGCTGSTNTDLDSNGYIYTVTVNRAVHDLEIQVFDPAQIAVGDHCNNSNDSNGNDQAKLAGAASLPAGAANTVGGDASVRYAPNDGPWCTGDRNGAAGGALNQTSFTVHGVGTNAWDPVNWPLQAGCGAGANGSINPKTFDPFAGDLSKALNKKDAGYKPLVAANFRQWVHLCTISGTVQPGTYAIQVQTSVPGGQGGHNRFGLRAFGSSASDKDNISVAGFDKMGIFANFTGTTQFYLARVPSAAAGQILNVRLFDVGDGSASGTITILKPAESTVDFVNCNASGATAALTRALPTCSLTNVSSSTNQGRWQNVAVPIPSAYTCSDNLTTGCWVILKYDYGSGNPADATSWTASIQGDPVRLVE